MMVGHEFLRPDDRDMVSALVSTSFKNISRLLTGYDTPSLDAEQRRAALGAMRLISDLRVQRIGVEVAWAIKDSSTEQPLLSRRAVMQKDMIRRIAERLQPRYGEIEQ